MIYNNDDSPLYLFESSIESHRDLKDLLNDYEVPKYFTEDFFDLVKIIINNKILLTSLVTDVDLLTGGF